MQSTTWSYLPQSVLVTSKANKVEHSKLQRRNRTGAKHREQNTENTENMAPHDNASIASGDAIVDGEASAASAAAAGGADSAKGRNGVRDWLAKHHPKELALLDKFEMQLRLGRLSGTGKKSTTDRRVMTVHTVELLKQMIGNTWWKSPAQLLWLLRGLGRELHAAGGFREPAIGNVVRRIMAAVREEAASGAKHDQDHQQSRAQGQVADKSSAPGSASAGNALSLESMMWSLPQHVKSHSRTRSESLSQHPSTSLPAPSPSTSADNISYFDAERLLPAQFYEPQPALKQAVMEAIQEIAADLEDLQANIAQQATNHIHTGEVILTYGKSTTVYKFLAAVAEKKRQFTVIVCENAPHYDGHEMASDLAKAGIETIVIHDSAVFGIMARVNKVLLGAHAVLANGGLIGPAGSNIAALAANQNAIPVVCLTGMFKFTPLFPHGQQDTLNDMLSASSLLGFQERSSSSDITWKDVEVVNPVHDYIRPKLINLYVTNVGSFPPSYIYRVLAEYYHNDDWESFE